MAYSLDKNQNTYLFTLAKNAIRFIQIFCMFYAFFGLIYWLLYTSNVKDIQNFYWVFKPSWDLVKLFYTYSPPASNPQAIDFTGVIGAIAMIILSTIAKNGYEIVEENEEKHKLIQRDKVKKQAKLNTKTSSTVTRNEPKELVEFIFILEVQITNLSNFIQDEKLSAEEIENLKEKFYESFLNNLNKNQIRQKGIYNKRLYLIYKDFNYIDNFIFYTRETLNALSREFSRPTLKIDFLVGLTKLYATDNLNSEINILDTIICLGIKNEFICTSAFKLNYDRRDKKQYKLVTKGIYNLSKNLNISNNQELYSLKDNS